MPGPSAEGKAGWAHRTARLQKGGRVYGLQHDSHLLWFYPLFPQEAPSVMPPRTQLGPLGLCVKARNKDSSLKAARLARPVWFSG